MHPDVFLKNGDDILISNGDQFYRSHIYTFRAKKHIGYRESYVGQKVFVKEYNLGVGDVRVFKFDLNLLEIQMVCLGGKYFTGYDNDDNDNDEDIGDEDASSEC